MGRARSFIALSIFSWLAVACSPGDFGSFSLASRPARPVEFEHPPQPKPEPPRQFHTLVPREYVEQLFLEIFSSPSYSEEQQVQLADTVRVLVKEKPASFGGSCNLYDTPSGRDCGGDFAGTNLPLAQEPSVARGLDTIVACELLVSKEIFLLAALDNIGAGPSGEPSAAAIGELYSLFRRGWDPDPQFVATLLELNQSLSSAEVPARERWRLLVLTACEDPFWQSL